jgi:site-specific recombinase XerD
MSSTLGQIIEHVADAYSPNTIRAYRADFEEFIAFCHQINETALPATPETTAAFIDSVTANSRSSASIRRKLVAIAAIHRLSRNGDPTKDAEVHLAMRKMHRKLGRVCDQAYGITTETLEKMMQPTGDDLRGKRDRALLLLAYATMRRRSELVSLQIHDITPTSSGAAILLRRSKTDQEGSGTWLHVTGNAYAAITDWLQAAGISDGYLLRGVRTNGELTEQLCGGQIGRIYKRLAICAGLPTKTVEQISGHSLRVGAAQDLLRHGASLPQIMVKGGWSKVDTVMRYVEKATIDPMSTWGGGLHT